MSWMTPITSSLRVLLFQHAINVYLTSVSYLPHRQARLEECVNPLLCLCLTCSSHISYTPHIHLLCSSCSSDSSQLFQSYQTHQQAASKRNSRDFFCLFILVVVFWLWLTWSASRWRRGTLAVSKTFLIHLTDACFTPPACAFFVVFLLWLFLIGFVRFIFCALCVVHCAS